MPVRSLSSSVLKWPDRSAVDQAVREWAAHSAVDPRVVRVGYFGSYARGNWGMGSDVDIVMVVEEDGEPFERRPARWDLTGLPVPAEMVVYTVEEWDRLKGHGRFGRVMAEEVVWVFPSAAQFW